MGETVTIQINRQRHEVAAGLTVMQAADACGYHIPRLCHHSRLSLEGACRVCIVEVEGVDHYVAACSHPVEDQMVITTHSPALRRARRDIVELLLDNHPQDCHVCEQDSRCELQRLAYSMGLRRRRFEGQRKQYGVDESSQAVVRHPSKCVLCGRCVRLCAEVQGIQALGQAHRGYQTVVMPAYDLALSQSVCCGCGQCVQVCPTAAFTEHWHAERLFDRLSESTGLKVAQVAPAVRVALGEALGLPLGRPVEGQIVATLHRLGFDLVFDTQLGADLTVMEESSEFLERLQGRGPLPLMTSCCPAWVRVVEQFHPDWLGHLSSCRSPAAMLAAIVKSAVAEKRAVPAHEVFLAAVMPCTAKKSEIQRPDATLGPHPLIDAVVTTRELAWMIESAGIDFARLEPERFDRPLGVSSGAGSLFGVTGGVAEAVIRTAYELYSAETLYDIEWAAARGFEGTKEAHIEMDGTDVRVAVVHGLGHAHRLLERLRRHPDRYHLVEVMACPYGCIGGGGQPVCREPAAEAELMAQRAEALYAMDRTKTIRRSHENPDVQRLYREFLGRPLSARAQELLHTRYRQVEPTGVVAPLAREVSDD